MLAGSYSRGRLVALSCAVACAAAAAGLHLRARRRAAASLRERRSSALDTTPSTLAADCRGESCDDPGLAVAFQDATRQAANLHCADEQRLQLYALYKQATVGACALPAPSRLDFVAHAKWRAWQQVAGLTKQCAMAAYISLVGQLTGPPSCDASQVTGIPQAASRSSAGFGPVQSTLASKTPASIDAGPHEPDSLLARVKAGDKQGVADLLSRGDPPDAARDACGRTPLLWAADAGNAELVALLLAAGADVSAADEDGGVPLLHAALCGHELCARALLAAGADAWARDADGCCAAEVRPAEWSDWWPSC